MGKNGARKSKNLQYIKKNLNRCLIGDYSDGATMGIEDGSISMQSLKGNNYVGITGEQAMKTMLRNATEYLDRPDTKIYVFMIDKPFYTMVLKSIVQSDRQESDQNIPAPDPVEGVPYVPLDTVLEHEWGRIMANPKGRRAVMKEFVESTKKHFYPPQGKLLIIDVEYDGHDSLPVFIHSQIGKENEQNRKFCVWSYDENTEMKRTVTDSEEAKNTVGECDHCCLHWIYYFIKDREKNSDSVKSEDKTSVQVFSRDTDYVSVLLSHVRTIQKSGITIDMVNRNTGQRAKEIPVDIISMDILKEILEKDVTTLKRPELDFCIAIMITGTDYLDTYDGISVDNVLDWYLENREEIGNLVAVDSEGNWNLIYEAYDSFLKCLYCLKYEKRIRDYVCTFKKEYFTSESGTKIRYTQKRKSKERSDIELSFNIQDVEFDVKEGCSWWKRMQWPIIRHVVKQANKNDARHVPCEEDISLKFKRTCMNLKMIELGYRSKPSFLDDQVLDFGFSLICAEKGISKFNIKASVHQKLNPKKERKSNAKPQSQQKKIEFPQLDRM